jgi:cytochrome c-type biogenesis protein
VLYALGMATVLAILTVAAALFGQTLTRRAAKIGRYVPRVSAVLLLMVGGYVVYYWLTAGGLLADLIP